ncbi:MAG: hypothetical protein R2758_05795 [Bacteroidales bacterium]
MATVSSTEYLYPIITRDHTPVFPDMTSLPQNPHLMTRLGINTAFNAGAIKHGKYCLAIRTEGFDVKSFFAIAETGGIDHWRFRNHPIVMPVTGDPEMNVYDIEILKLRDEMNTTLT